MQPYPELSLYVRCDVKKVAIRSWGMTRTMTESQGRREIERERERERQRGRR